MCGDALPAAGKRKGYEYLRAKYRNSETSLMPGYITAQGARDLVAQWAAKEEIQPFLDAIYGVVRDAARMGKTQTMFYRSTSSPTERQGKAICKVLVENGYNVVINASNHFIISWD